MAHNLTVVNGTARFADNERTGLAWHGLCKHTLTGQTAVEAWQTVGQGIVQKSLPLGVQGRQTYVALPHYQGLVSIFDGHLDGGVQINGHTLYPLGCVTDQYVPLFHADIVPLIDQAIDHAPIDTMGLLGQSGHTLFTSIALPHFDVAGDEIATYLNIGNPVDGKVPCGHVQVSHVWSVKTP